jgi:hypothetical protein
MGEPFSITSDQPIDDDFSSSDCASATTAITKTLISSLVSEDVVLLWELELFLASIDIVLCIGTEISRFLSLQNFESYISLIYALLTLFTALLRY